MNGSSLEPSNPTLPVVMSFDDGYLIPALVALFSAKSSFPGTFRLFVVYDKDSLSVLNREVLTNACGILNINITLLAIELPHYIFSQGHFTVSTWARLFIPSLVKEPFVYLDADVLCFPGWESLLEYDIVILEGVSAVGALEIEGDLCPENQAVLASGGCYVNAGVLIMNPEQFPSTYEADVAAACTNYDQLGFQWVDQCVLNYVLRGKISLMDRGFNTQVRNNQKLPKHYFVLHYSGAAKPWQAVTRVLFLTSPSVLVWRSFAKRMFRELVSSGIPTQFLKKEYASISKKDWINSENISKSRVLLLRLVRFCFSRF